MAAFVDFNQDGVNDMAIINNDNLEINIYFNKYTVSSDNLCRVNDLKNVDENMRAPFSDFESKKTTKNKLVYNLHYEMGKEKY